MSQISDEEMERLEALGPYYDEHGEEEWAQAERNGEVFTPADFGCSSVLEASRAHMAAKAASKSRQQTYTLTLTLPVRVMDTIRHRAEERHETEEKFLSDLILQAA
jgi:hypothetical protein